MGPSIEGRNALVAKLGEVFLSLIVDFWLSFQLSRKISISNQDDYRLSTTVTKNAFVPCQHTAELLLIVVQHLSMIGVLEKIQPVSTQNSFLLANQQKLYGVMRKPLFDYLMAVFTSMPYQFNMALFSQVIQFPC